MNVVHKPFTIPVIVGVGEITDKFHEIEKGLEPIELMAEALRRAEWDSGIKLLKAVDSIDIVAQNSWPYPDTLALLSERLKIQPRCSVYGEAGGESPVRFIHEAALRIARGESKVAAIVGAESSYTVYAASKAGINLPWSPCDPHAKLLPDADIANEIAFKHGMTSAVSVYPLYENASQAAWGQTQWQALRESADLWSRHSSVAARNPYAWHNKEYSANEIAIATPNNRILAWPYTLQMVANPLVNMGAGVLVTSLGQAIAQGINRDKLIYIVGGAAAKEPRDYLQRDQFKGSHAQDAVLEAALELGGGDVRAFGMLELYCCSPVVPKMARRSLGLPADAPMTSTGGLSFFGSPFNNYMTHAATGAVRGLRGQHDKQALLYGQGELVTKHHALVLSSKLPNVDLLTNQYSVQNATNERIGPVPPLVESYQGMATLETFTVVFGSDGKPEFGTVIGLTPNGERLMARVPASDQSSIRFLTDLDKTPVGSRGEVFDGADGLLHWRIRQ